MEKQLMSNVDGFPSDSMIESDLLGSILLNNENFYLVKDILDPIFFSLPHHQELYKVISNLMLFKKSVTESLLIEHIRSNDLLEKVGGINFIITLQERIITGDAVLATANKIRELYLRRKLMVMYSEGIDLCKKSLDEFSESVVGHADSIIKLVKTGNTKKAIPILEALDKVILSVIDKGHKFAIPSKFSNLDFLIGNGFSVGTLVVIAARPGVGKTSLGMDFVYNISEQSFNTMVISLEMSINELVIRGISRFTGISRRDIEEKKFLEDKVSANLISESREKVFKVIKLFLDADSSSIQSIISSIEAQHRIDPLRVVFIDYLQLIDINNSKENKNIQISEITRKLKLLAMKLDITIILASQLNREVTKRDGGKPILSDLRDSGSIEQDADIVMFLYSEDVEKSNDRTLTIAKNRTGQGNVSIKLLFNGALTTFKEKNNEEDCVNKSYYEPQGDDA